MSLLSQPLYGLLQAKLQLITHAYFEEKDFSQISILKVSNPRADLLVALLRWSGRSLPTNRRPLRPDRSSTST